MVAAPRGPASGLSGRGCRESGPSGRAGGAIWPRGGPAASFQLSQGHQNTGGAVGRAAERRGEVAQLGVANLAFRLPFHRRAARSPGAPPRPAYPAAPGAIPAGARPRRAAPRAGRAAAARVVGHRISHPPSAPQAGARPRPGEGLLCCPTPHAPPCARGRLRCTPRPQHERPRGPTPAAAAARTQTGSRLWRQHMRAAPAAPAAAAAVLLLRAVPAESAEHAGRPW